jgi:acyl-CoA thioesterase
MLYCGIKITELTAEHCISQADVAEHLKNTGVTVHGGFLFTMADCTASALARGLRGTAVTADTDFHFLSNVTDGKLTCCATVLHAGGRLLRFHVEVTSAGKVLSEGTFTCYHSGK